MGRIQKNALPGKGKGAEQLKLSLEVSMPRHQHRKASPYQRKDHLDLGLILFDPSSDSHSKGDRFCSLHGRS